MPEPTAARPGPLLVPPLSPLPDELVDRHAAAHRQVSDRFRSVPAAVRTVTLHLCRRVLVESLANLQPTWLDPDRPLLLPSPRAFLDDRLTTRRRGAAEAYRYLSARLAMVRTGAIADVVDHGVAEVVNALVQAAPRSTSVHDETNPGIVRATATWWRPDVSRFAHPAPEQCGPLLRATVDLVRQAPVPAIARAGWLAFMVNTIHPFVDGNGRTHRALALGLSSSTPTGVDWGLLEQWALDRPAYIDALAAGHLTTDYSASGLDPVPFVRHTVAASERGARLTLERLAVVGRLVEELASRGLTEPAAQATAIVVIDRFVRLDELVTLLRGGARDGSDLERHDLVVALVQSGLLRWADPPPGRAGAGAGGDGAGLVPGEPVADLVDLAERCVSVGPEPI